MALPLSLATQVGSLRLVRRTRHVPAASRGPSQESSTATGHRTIAAYGTDAWRSFTQTIRKHTRHIADTSYCESRPWGLQLASPILANRNLGGSRCRAGARTTDAAIDCAGE